MNACMMISVHESADHGACALDAIVDRVDTRFRVQPVNHTYSFFDFQSIVPDTISFEPCIMLPGVSGCDCLRLGCAVDQSDSRTAVEQQRADATLNEVTFNVTQRDGPCVAPEGYVGRSGHNVAIAAACALLHVRPGAVVARWPDAVFLPRSVPARVVRPAAAAMPQAPVSPRFR